MARAKGDRPCALSDGLGELARLCLADECLRFVQYPYRAGRNDHFCHGAARYTDAVPGLGLIAPPGVASTRGSGPGPGYPETGPLG